jgi:hypothetical protein
VVAEALAAATATGAPTRVRFRIDAEDIRVWFRLLDDGRAPLPERDVRRIGYRVGLLDGAVSRVTAVNGGRELDCWFPMA